jgi:hypothetical protein
MGWNRCIFHCSIGSWSRNWPLTGSRRRGHCEDQFLGWTSRGATSIHICICMIFHMHECIYLYVYYYYYYYYYIYILIIYLLVKCEPLYIYMGRWIDCFSIRDLGWMLVELPLSCIFDRFSMSKIPTMGWIKVRCVSKPRCLWRATDNKTFQAMEWKETKLKPRDMSLLNFLIYI